MRIEWSLFAIGDREAIFDYIQADSARAAVMVDDRIEAQIDHLVQFPEMGRTGRVSGTRELVLTRTPYLAIYRIEDATIRILRILHGAQQWPDEPGE